MDCAVSLPAPKWLVVLVPVSAYVGPAHGGSPELLQVSSLRWVTARQMGEILELFRAASNTGLVTERKTSAPKRGRNRRGKYPWVVCYLI